MTNRTKIRLTVNGALHELEVEQGLSLGGYEVLLRLADAPERSMRMVDLAEYKRPDTSHGILTPAGTPRAVVDQLNREIVRILNLPDVRERLNAISYVIAPSSPQEYDTLLRAQIASLANLTRDIGLRPR